MLNILIPFRDREISRLKNSFNSLGKQSIKNFEVFLIDYGSKPETAEVVKKVCEEYGFNYSYCFTQYQPWNKCRALNSVIKNLTSEFCFVADVDIVFHPNFIEEVQQLQNHKKVVFFQVGFMEEGKFHQVNFHEAFEGIRKSQRDATGLSLFPVKSLRQVNGFDEFYHFWGAEDTDIHVRLRNSGYEIEFFDEQVFLLHQWHPSYRRGEKGTLTRDLQVTGIVQLNHKHLKLAEITGRTRVNENGWGVSITKKDVEELDKASIDLHLSNKKNEIDAFLFGFLPGGRSGILKVKFSKDDFTDSVKYQIKKLLGKKVPEYYSLKEINDKVLLHLISFYRDLPYSFKIDNNLSEIELSIKFSSDAAD